MSKYNIDNGKTAIVDQTWKTQSCYKLKHTTNDFDFYAWMKKFVFFFAWKEASFGFRKMTW